MRCVVIIGVVFFFKQKTAYEMRISDWSSDVCSSDLPIVTEMKGTVTYVGMEEGITIKRQTDELTGMTNIEVLDAKDRPAAGKDIRPRSEERRVGKECVSTCRSRWSPYH